MRTQIIIGAILLSASAAKAYNYSDTISRNQSNIGYNRYYAKYEAKYSKNLQRKKQQLAGAIEAYRQAHLKVERLDAEVRQLEANYPSHRTYRSDWSYGSTAISWKEMK